jgi:hypothetical protein
LKLRFIHEYNCFAKKIVSPLRLATPALGQCRAAEIGGVAEPAATHNHNGTCKGTSIGRDLEYYAKRPRPDDDWHGPGAGLLAGAEILRAAKKINLVACPPQ